MVHAGSRYFSISPFRCINASRNPVWVILSKKTITRNATPAIPKSVGDNNHARTSLLPILIAMAKNFMSPNQLNALAVFLYIFIDVLKKTSSPYCQSLLKFN